MELKVLNGDFIVQQDLEFQPLSHMDGKPVFCFHLQLDHKGQVISTYFIEALMVMKLDILYSSTSRVTQIGPVKSTTTKVLKKDKNQDKTESTSASNSVFEELTSVNSLKESIYITTDHGMPTDSLLEPFFQIESTPSKANEQTSKNNKLHEEFISISSANKVISTNKYDENAAEFILEPSFQIELTPSKADEQTNKNNKLHEEFI